jgi:hypothetical protein
MFSLTHEVIGLQKLMSLAYFISKPNLKQGMPSFFSLWANHIP